MITASKGGIGKSVLTWMLAEKYRDALILDLDIATKTTTRQLAYRKPILVSFLDPITKRIDRSAFNGLFESVAETEKEIFIADLSGAVSQQLPEYFKTHGPGTVAAILTSLEIDLQIVCVIGGENEFKTTMEYLVELRESVGQHFKVIAAHNLKTPFTRSQQEEFFAYHRQTPGIYATYDLVKDKGEGAMKVAAEVLQAGKGQEGLSPFKAIYFNPLSILNDESD